jgi:hypothetical protein
MTTGDGSGLPGPGRAGGVELCGTVQQQLVFLNTHWGSKYSFAAPAKPRDPWTAAARFGHHEELTGKRPRNCWSGYTPITRRTSQPGTARYDRLRARG